jgi:hypothetical protein
MRAERAGSVFGGSVAGSVCGYGSMRRTTTQATMRSGLSYAESVDEAGVEIPKRKSSIGRAGGSRAPSLTKGFL